MKINLQDKEHLYVNVCWFVPNSRQFRIHICFQSLSRDIHMYCPIQVGGQNRRISIWKSRYTWLISGGCSPVDWLSQTRRNLTTEFLDLKFESSRKLYKNLVFYENINTVAFIRKGFYFLAFLLIPVSQVHTTS